MSVGLPEGWCVVRLNDLLEAGGLFDGPFGSSLKTSDYTSSGARVVRLENLGHLHFIEDKRTFVSRQKYEALKRHGVAEGDILFGSFIDGPARVCLLPQLDTPAIAKADCFCIRPNGALVDRRYLAFQLGTLRTRDALIEDIHGATRPRITTKQLRDLDIMLCPPPEQRRIVATVDALLAEVNAARDRLAKVPAILKRFRQSVLAVACSGRLTEDWRERMPGEDIETTLKRVRVAPSKTGREATEDVIAGICILSVGDPGTATPRGWRWTALTDVARLESGHTPSRKHPEYWGGNIPWIGILDANAHHGGVIVKTKQTVTQAGLNNSAARLLPARTVCLSRTASVGYVVIMGREMATSQDFVNWVCSDALVPEFLMYALMAEGEDIKRFGRGTTHTTIYFPEVKALHICLPPVSEQHAIVQRIGAVLPLADATARTVASAQQRAERMSQAVLAKAFRGDLVPTEAELARQEGRGYEPAAALIEKVRREHTATGAHNLKREVVLRHQGRVLHRPARRARRLGLADGAVRRRRQG